MGNNNDDLLDPSTTETLSERLLGPGNVIGAIGSKKEDIEGQQTVEGEGLIFQTDHPEHVVLDEEPAAHNNNDDLRQTVGFRDAWAAVLFVGHFGLLAYLAFGWGIRALKHFNDDYDDEADKDEDYPSVNERVTLRGVVVFCIVTSLAALLLSGASLMLMMKCAKQLVQISLLFSTGCNLLVAVLFATFQVWQAFGLSLVFAAISAYYAYLVWDRIPFAAANLTTALAAIQNNGGLLMVAYVMTLAVNFSTWVWALAWYGVYERTLDCPDQGGGDDEGKGECVSHMNGLVAFSFLLSLYWLVEVGRNVLHCTVSGVVGTFWFSPDQADSFCSPAIHDSWWRASTYSLGSICLGSLLRALLQALHTMARSARRHQSESLFRCVVECILRCLDRIVEYFNKWAYIYIGLYGYDYLTAGKKVTELFAQRGWTNIINDQLIVRTLGAVSLVISMLTGVVGVFWTDAFVGAHDSDLLFLSFVVGAVLGFSLSHVCLGVVASGADTVVVAFAEAPLDLERNHPGLHRQMTTAWRQVYPDEFGPIVSNTI